MLAAGAAWSQPSEALVYIECEWGFYEKPIGMTAYFIDEKHKQVLGRTKRPVGTTLRWDDQFIEVKTEPVPAGKDGKPLYYRFDRISGEYQSRVEGTPMEGWIHGMCVKKPIPQQKF